MGNSISGIQKQQFSKKFIRTEWQILSHHGLYEIWQNKITNQICQAYNLDHVPNQKSLEHYRFRYNNQNTSYFVSIKYLSIYQDKNFCSTGQSYVLTEFIPIKLRDIKKLQLLEAYSFLKAAYCAFNTIQAFHGPFNPSGQMIGVNLKGKPKIWINKNHSKDTADRIDKVRIWQKHQSQISDNVRKIIQMIQQKLVNIKFPNEFHSYFYDNILNYFQAYQFVEQYCQKKKIEIPENIDYLKHIEDDQILRIATEYHKKTGYCQINQTKSYEKLSEKKHNTQSVISNCNETTRKMIYNINIKQEKILSNNKIVFNHLNNTINNNQQKNMPILQRVSTLPVINKIFSKSHQINSSKPLQRRVQILDSHNKVSKGLLLSPVNKVIINNNIINSKLVTPKHIGDNFKFTSPHRIAQFQKPQRQLISQILFNPVRQLVTIAESKYCGHANQVQNRITTQAKIVNIIIRQSNIKQVQSSNKKENLQRSFHEKIPVSEQKQLKRYISQQQDDNQNSHVDVSEPDWQNMQHEYKQKLNHIDQEKEYQNSNQDGLNSQQQRYHRQMAQNEQNASADDEQQNDQIKIKINNGKETDNYEQNSNMVKPLSNEEYQFMFKQSGYAQNDQYVRNSRDQPSPGSKVKFQNNKFNQHSHYQSSSNTQNQFQQSSTTLVIHQSKQNIYNELNKHKFIKKQSFQLQNNDNNIVSQIQINQSNKININNKKSITKQINQPNPKSYQSKSSVLLQMKKIIFQYPNQTQDKTESQINNYKDLHFRNQSDQLYQYRPTDYYNETNVNLDRQTDNLPQISKLTSHKQIQDYIKNKYSHMLSQPNISTNKQTHQIKLNQNYQEEDHNQFKRNSRQYKKNSRQSKRNSRQDRTMTFAKKLQENSQENYDFVKNSKYVDSIPSYDYVDSSYNNDNSLPQIVSNNIYKKEVEFIMGNIESQYYKPPQYQHEDMMKFYNNNPDNKNNNFIINNSNNKLAQNYKSSNIFSDEDGFNVAVLDQKLQKFEQIRQNVNKSQEKLDQVPKSLQNLSQFDNFVEMMDKKIQQSQSRAKITSSRSGTQKQIQQKYDIFNTDRQIFNNNNPSNNNNNNINYPLNYIPMLTKQNNSKKQSEQFDINIKMVSQQNRNRRNSGKDKNNVAYESSKQNAMNKVFSFSKKLLEPLSDQRQRDINQQKKIKRVSKRLSAAHDANKLAEQIEKKYQKHFNRDFVNIKSKNNQNNYNNWNGSQGPLTNMGNYALQLPSENNIMGGYVSGQNKSIESQNKINYHLEMNEKRNNIYVNLADNSLQSYKTLSSNMNQNQVSNRASNLGSKKSLGLIKRASKVSYQQLRDLLWN